MTTDPITPQNLAQLDGASPAMSEPPEKGESSKSHRSAASLSQRAGASVHSMMLGSLLAVHGEPPRLPTEKRKPALSLSTTAVNFRGFVQKSGPMFYFQDSVEATMMWDDWPWTMMWMGVWAVLGTCA